MFWRSSRALLGAPIIQLVRRAKSAGGRRAREQAQYELAFSRAFAAEAATEFDDTELVEESEWEPLSILVARDVWRASPPRNGFAHFMPGEGGAESSADRELIDVLAAKTGRPWHVEPIAGAVYPVLGGGEVAASVTHRDVQVEKGRPLRVYRFSVNPLRTEITEAILELEYRAMATVAKTDDQFDEFSRMLWSYLREFFENYAKKITQYFPAESASIFILRLRGDDKSHASTEGGTTARRALLPMATHGMLAALEAPEIYPLDGTKEAGIIPEFVLNDQAICWIPFDRDDPKHRRTDARVPNFQNMARNARLGDAFNTLLIKLRVPRKPGASGTTPTQAFGALRLVNCFEPQGGAVESAAGGAQGFAPLKSEPFWIPS